MRISQLIERSIEANDIASVLKNGYYWSEPATDPDGISRQEKINDLEDFMYYLDQYYHLDDIGGGYFSIAYVNDNGDEPEFVLKMHRDGTRVEEDGWFKFAETAVKHPNNPLFPKILYHGSLKNSDGDYQGIGILEYLKVNKSEVEEFYRTRVEKIIERDKIGVDLPFRRTMEYVIRNFGRKENTLEMANIICEVFDINIEHFVEFAKEVGPFAFIDIHGDNVGWRRNGEFVIFDPVS